MAKKNNIMTYEHDTWIAVYALDKKEHFEIRTQSAAFPGYTVLSHSEKPLGTALTDLFYSSMIGLPFLLSDLFDGFSLIRTSRTERGLRTAIDKIIKAENRLWSINPVYAHFILVTEDLLSEAKIGGDISTAGLSEEMGKYLLLLPEIRNTVEKCFDIANYEAPAGKSASRLFFDHQKADHAKFPVLHFSTIRHELVKSGCDLSWPSFEQRTGKVPNRLLKDEHYYETNTDVLETKDLADIIYFLISRCLQEEIRMKTCKYCGLLFPVTDNYGAEYCNRLIDGSTKTCREIGSVRLYEQRILVDPIMQAYKRSYKTHNARIRYGYSTKEEFTAWSKEARAMRDKCIAGEITLDEFTAWLDSDKMR